MSGDQPEALERELLARGTRPGMVDIAAIRAGSRGEAGLGLAHSPITRRLGARRTAGGAVAGGELVHPLRAILESGDPQVAAPDEVDPLLPVAGRPARPGAGGVPVQRGGAAGLATGGAAADVASAPAVLAATVPASSGPGATSIMLPATRRGRTPAPTPSEGSAAMTAVDVPLVDADPTADAAVMESDLALAARPGIAALAGAGAQAMAVGPASAATQAGTPASRAIFSEPAEARPLVAAGSASPAAFAGAAPGMGDLSERVQRDLERRLAVERERQGLARWKR